MCVHLFVCSFVGFAENMQMITSLVCSEVMHLETCSEDARIRMLALFADWII